MSKTAIIIDSLACIPKEVVERYKIGIVPVIIFFEGKSYRDWIDLTPAKATSFLSGLLSSGKAQQLLRRIISKFTKS